MDRMYGEQAATDVRAQLIAAFQRVRSATDALAAPLSEADQQLQSMALCSPTKWHRAHTTWFFETFVLAGPPFDARYALLFNSYYEAVGPRFARPQRGLLSRPTAAEIGAYRRAVDARVLERLETCDEAVLSELAPRIELGLAHEQQHQELILTDILHAFSINPLAPAYAKATEVAPAAPHALSFREHDGGVVEIGASARGFAFDNERPRHREYVEPFALASRAVTVAEVKAFIAADGYRTPSLWLSEGLERVRAEGWCAPLHARIEGGAYVVFTLSGERQAHDDEPVSHVSFYEADAIARFLGARLPTEAEWEHAASRAPIEGNFVEDAALSPRAARGEGLTQLYGDVWEWTRSSYAPYPGFTPEAGALSEYNGKFMVGQMVLRGGSCLTPRGHVRPSYRNFWPPDTRFQMTGVRLARDLGKARAPLGRAL